MCPADDDARRPFRVLSLDGGGIRGVAAAEVLRLLEADLGRPLREEFDMFAGTSVGALAAMSMVYGRLSAADVANRLYTPANARRMMPQTIWDWALGLVQDRPKYDGRGKRAVIERYLGGHQVYAPGGPLVLVPAFDVLRGETHFFKSWLPSRVSCADAADMSSAAPGYFPTVRGLSAPEEIEYGIDGGLGANNPADAAYADALRLAGGRPIVLVSVGTGHAAADAAQRAAVAVASRRWGGLQWVARGGLIDTALRASEDAVHYKMAEFSRALGDVYVRVDGPLANARMDDISEGNMHALREAGRGWFRASRVELLAALRPPEAPAGD
jgi:predicted acylesterase/phospholipase RssA